MGDGRESLIPAPNYNTPVKDLTHKDLLMITFTLRFRTQECIVITVEDSVLWTEMGDLESQEENAPKRILWYKTMTWLVSVRSHHRDEDWTPSL